MFDTIVVGSGIFGSVIAAHLRAGGQRVLVVGDDHPDSGSKPAGCIMRPSWISALNKEDYHSSCELLEALYGVRTIAFRLKPSGKIVHAEHVNPHSILRGCSAHPDFIAGRVTGISGEELKCVTYVASDNEIDHLRANQVVVAAGIWTPELCPWLSAPVKAQYGWSFRGPPVIEPIISLWAPYRQVVAFNMDDGRSWSGDGSALKLESATREREQKAEQRCRVAMQLDPLKRAELQSTRGARPYAATGGKPCLIERRGRIWAVTGGAKNGTIAAAWAARELEREMGL